MSVGRFDNPVYVTAPPGDKRRLFVVEQTGRIRVLVGGKRRSKPFLDLRRDVTFGGEQGLLSMAFAPDYAKTGRFYVNFTDRNGDTRVQEFQRSKGNPNRANRASRRAILFVNQPYPNHNGGLVLFGPDGYLYVGMGDGGAGGDPENRAQNLDSLLGKMLRIDPRPGAALSPPSNPFVGRAGRDEIYSYGLRNPWRFSFDRKTGDHLHRRRGTERARGDRLRAPRWRGGAELRLELLRGQAPVRQLAQLRRTRRRRCSTTAGAVANARLPAAWSCAILRSRGWRVVTSTAITAPG